MYFLQQYLTCKKNIRRTIFVFWSNDKSTSPESLKQNVQLSAQFCSKVAETQLSIPIDVRTLSPFKVSSPYRVTVKKRFSILFSSTFFILLTRRRKVLREQGEKFGQFRNNLSKKLLKGIVIDSQKEKIHGNKTRYLDLWPREKAKQSNQDQMNLDLWSREKTIQVQ